MLIFGAVVTINENTYLIRLFNEILKLDALIKNKKNLIILNILVTHCSYLLTHTLMYKYSLI